MHIKDKSILVTGGAGFIGSHLVEALLEAGARRIVVLDNLVRGRRENLAYALRDPRVTLHTIDICEANQTNFFDDVDICFHLACLGVRHSLQFPLENHRVNALGTLAVLLACRKAAVQRMLYCSSSEVYGTALTVPMSEAHPTEPNTVYGASKLAGEAYTRAFHRTYGMQTTVVRAFNAYGPRSHHEGDAGEVIPKSIVRCLNGKKLIVFGDGSQTRDFTYVRDTAQGLVLAAKSDALVGHTVNLGSGYEISIKELAQKIITLMDSAQGRIDCIESRPGDVLRLYADASKFRSITNWKPRTGLEAGLLNTINFFAQHPSGSKELLAQEVGKSWEAGL